MQYNVVGRLTNVERPNSISVTYRFSATVT